MPCIIGQYCRTHNFIHGAEAEELRERFEAIERQMRLDPESDVETLCHEIRRVLDTVDARDSAAFLFTKVGMKKITKPVDPKTGKGGTTVTKGK